MKTYFYHLSDTISHGDTTVLRLDLQYKCIAHYFGCSNIEVIYIASPVANSSYTAQQAIQLMYEWKDGERYSSVICVNNASRAKHKNSGNAKASPCYILEYQSVQGKVFHFCGVDDELFAYLIQYGGGVVLGCKRVDDITLQGVVHHDISQGSQFRSLEFRPLVQMIIAQYPDSYHNYLTCSEVNAQKHFFGYFHKQDILMDYDNTLFLLDDPNKLRPFFQHIQLLGQQRQRNFRWHQKIDLLHYKQYDLDRYYSLKTSLANNEILVIDRDHFGNTKCISKFNNGIFGILQALDLEIGCNIKIISDYFEETCFIVSSISDKTGQQCLRNGSSRGPNGEIFVELNVSFSDECYEWSALKHLKIGDRIYIQPF